MDAILQEQPQLWFPIDRSQTREDELGPPGSSRRLGWTSPPPRYAADPASVNAHASPPPSSAMPGPTTEAPPSTLAEVEEFPTGARLDVVVMDGGVCPAANHLTIGDGASDQAHLVCVGLVHPRAVVSVLGRALPTS
ncbi:hypothetical protein ACFRSX_30915 [Streptomyces goshikiensis]|uniref:hypothetical protein n=1 Tax=Streptomyces TaxID=1883 RepID=UPI00131DB272|nr:hypothetical protein [Streptomyces sp. CB02120-2]